MFLTWLFLLPRMQAFERRLIKSFFSYRLTPSDKKQFQKTAPHVYEHYDL